jgi:predicted O-methyltransferase YrrM
MPILTPAVEEYLAAHRAKPDDLLAEMEAHGERDGVPIVPPETGELLHVLARATGARRILEVGTAIGVSTLYLARALPDDGLLVSFEIDAERHAAARSYLGRAGLAERADLRLEDARTGLGSLDGTWDLAFIDAAKGQYADYLGDIVRLLRPGGLVVADNALMSGTVATGQADAIWPQALVDTGRAFVDHVLGHPDLTATVLPVGDGVALAVRR